MGVGTGKGGSGHLRLCNFLGDIRRYRHTGGQRGHPGRLMEIKDQRQSLGDHLDEIGRGRT